MSARPLEQDLARLGKLLDADDLPVDDLGWFKLAIEDAKVFYLEALTAQPGEYDQRQVQKTLWRETVLGAALIRFCEKFEATDNLRMFARIIAPREAVGRFTGDETTLGTTVDEDD